MNRPTRPDGTPVDVHPQELPASARAAALVSQPIALLLGVAALIAYRELLWYAPTKSLSEEVEQLFFLPSQGIAPLVVLLSAWLLYRRAARLRSLPPARAPRLGAALLGAAGLLHLWATLANAPDLLAPSLALAGFGVAALWKGRAAARAVLVPALFLVYHLGHANTADALREPKVKAATANGASYLASANFGCALHIATGLREQNQEIEVLHPVVLLDRQLTPAGW